MTIKWDIVEKKKTKKKKGDIEKEDDNPLPLSLPSVFSDHPSFRDAEYFHSLKDGHFFSCVKTPCSLQRMLKMNYFCDC